jgi:hypothetical protein
LLRDDTAIVCDENGFAVSTCHGALASAALCAFDLLELEGRDLRREPIEKPLLARLLECYCPTDPRANWLSSLAAP